MPAGRMMTPGMMPGMMLPPPPGVLQMQMMKGKGKGEAGMRMPALGMPRSMTAPMPSGPPPYEPEPEPAPALEREPKLAAEPTHHSRSTPVDKGGTIPRRPAGGGHGGGGGAVLPPAPSDGLVGADGVELGLAAVLAKNGPMKVAQLFGAFHALDPTGGSKADVKDWRSRFPPKPNQLAGIVDSELFVVDGKKPVQLSAAGKAAVLKNASGGRSKSKVTAKDEVRGLAAKKKAVAVPKLAQKAGAAAAPSAPRSPANGKTSTGAGAGKAGGSSPEKRPDPSCPQNKLYTRAEFDHFYKRDSARLWNEAGRMQSGKGNGGSQIPKEGLRGSGGGGGGGGLSRRPAASGQRPVLTAAKLEKVAAVEELVHELRGRTARAGRHVSYVEVERAVCTQFGVRRFPELGIGYPNDVGALGNLQKLESNVYLRIQCYVQGRTIGTLRDLEQDLAAAEEVPTFESLELGPLLRHPLVLKHFQPAATVTTIPDVHPLEIIGTALRR
eukprot:SAG22_NODE_1112_length_5535_cov_11.367918_4_plen_497_part_00